MGNVKASELRQGNIINVLYSSLARPSMEPRIMQAIVRGTDDKTVITDCAGVPNEDKCSGIPLTEDWLKKLGFEKMDYCYKISIGDGFLAIESESYSSDICDNEGNYNVGNYTCLNGKATKHVHQLQNLYFALTGEELKTKDL